MPSLYVHIPFCLSKCYYCDFVSAIHENRLAERYTAAICQESALQAARLRTLPGSSPDWLQAPTVFFGGGTPTTLTVPQLASILDALRRDFGLAPDVEVTIEANPRTHVFTEPGRLEELREQGFNRLSIGAQTFDNELLQLIGRDHSASHVQRAVSRARQAGFQNLSVDLIYALPGQTLRGWEDTLRRALDLGTAHISLYSLTIEEGTVFGERHRRGELEAAPSDLEAEMYERAIETLTAAGFEQYEVSNFCKPGFRSRHNQVYWRREDYLGLGVGAHSCLWNERFANGRNTLLHVQAVEAGRLPAESHELLETGEMVGEAMWLGLRLLDGVRLPEVARRFGCDPKLRFAGEIDALLRRGLVRLENETLSLTRRGLFLGNEVFCEFV